MSDPFKTTTKQETDIEKKIEDKKKASSYANKTKETAEKEKKVDRDVSALYYEGISLLRTQGFRVELDEMGDHVNHRILKPSKPPEVKGISYPDAFRPHQDIYTAEDFTLIEKAFRSSDCEEDVRKFWTPIFRPKAGDSDLLSFTLLLLKMKRMEQTRNLHKTLDYGHTFDPAARLDGEVVLNPRIWVPDEDWFDPKIRELKFSDVFTIFPEAEQEILKLILGRIGVGRSNHLPPGKSVPVNHTARMAGVIVGKDAGLGKSTLFNGLTAALQQCGFVTHTFKSTEDRFGLKSAALSDVSYKDDTSLASLKKFLAAEETKILITNGIFQVEEKFESPEQLWPKTVILVNSNDWNSKFAYDLDPGIIDRIKLISTYREYEVIKNKEYIKGTVSEGSPDLRPRAHIPFLANKLGVSEDALYLWCLRIATNRFWTVINDESDLSVNRLQVEVRYWTTRQRIRFKADVTQALVNGMAFAWMLRTGGEDLPELNPAILSECLDHFYFLGVDPSGANLMARMKEAWEKAGRPTTHYYQGFREVRWESVKKTVAYYLQTGKDLGDTTAIEVIRDLMERLVMRDGFKIGGSANYVIENWENMRHAMEELSSEGKNLIGDMDEWDRARLLNTEKSCYDSWIHDKQYSPDNAEKFREKARTALQKTEGV